MPAGGGTAVAPDYRREGDAMILSGGITVCRCEDGILGHYVVRRHEIENWTYLGVVGSNYSRRWFTRCAVASRQHHEMLCFR